MPKDIEKPEEGMPDNLDELFKSFKEDDPDTEENLDSEVAASNREMEKEAELAEQISKALPLIKSLSSKGVLPSDIKASELPDYLQDLLKRIQH